MRQREIIAASLISSLVLLFIMVVVARFLWSHKSSKDRPETDGERSVDPVQKETSLLSRARSVKLFSAPKKERGHWVPTLSGIIKAGDEGIFSSSLLNVQHVQHGTPGELSLQDVYDAFAHELRNRPVAERGTYTSEINKFLTSTKKVQRTQSVSASPPRRPDLSKRASRKSVDGIRKSIDLGDLGIGRTRSVKKLSSPNLVSLSNSLPFEAGGPGPVHTLWDQDLQHALVFQGHTSVPVTGHELAALSVVLGSPVDISLDAQNDKCDTWANTYKGALGVSIAATATSDGSYHISLASNKRNVSQLPAKGSGYSTLHAKHLASGSLPFASDRKTINSILITPDTLSRLKTGESLYLQPTGADTKGSQFLARLPNARAPNFHALAPSKSANSTSRLLHAVGDLVFTGGFTPFASIPLIQTVRFVASGGLVPGRLLQRLDALVEKVHRQAPHLQLFGPLLENTNAHLRFRVNERLSRLARGTLTDEALADKVARMSRYTTLLERLMALVPDMRPADVLAAVRDGLKAEMERSYEDAVAAHLIGGTILPDSTSKRNSSVSRKDTRRRSRLSDNDSSGTASPDGQASGRPSSTFPVHNLGRQVEDVLKGSLPLDVQTVVHVARLVLVAWTLSVEGVAWGQGRLGSGWWTGAVAGEDVHVVSGRMLVMSVLGGLDWSGYGVWFARGLHSRRREIPLHFTNSMICGTRLVQVYTDIIHFTSYYERIKMGDLWSTEATRGVSFLVIPSDDMMIRVRRPSTVAQAPGEVKQCRTYKNR
ncbi:uncharacterized protein N0V89_010088 [Didymosphaeria variabile]|uniref:Uncharacterized protein n=1 Tax=Didymosphaeria variabile TaxID=1932322 RepID=A0A9W8XF71_9PLEO|nr:uncharacterized protein N0V89_010088 [Didymosphaeria variabile]KAJ4348710.1 hypothetical protein N0V89_010088 [Didymosphaeria variabile]